MDSPRTERITLILERAREGDEAAETELFHLVYEDLRRAAQGCMRRQGPTPTLWPTGLVHEVYIKLFARGSAGYENRAHFFAVAACAMRSILVDRARARTRRKRQAPGRRMPLDAVVDRAASHIDSDVAGLLDLDRALDRLGEVDSRAARVVGLRFFLSMSVEEIAELMDVSRRSVERDWAWARAWLRRQLDDTGAE